ncbi:unnamed protein product [Linum tenue]|nr:unnamed protein product [Linum tenue]
MELIRESAGTHPHYILISQIRQLLSRDWQVVLKHVFREGNMAADYLASLGHSLSVGEHAITTPFPTLERRLVPSYYTKKHLCLLSPLFLRLPHTKLPLSSLSNSLSSLVTNQRTKVKLCSSFFLLLEIVKYIGYH